MRSPAGSATGRGSSRTTGRQYAWPATRVGARSGRGDLGDGHGGRAPGCGWTGRLPPPSRAPLAVRLRAGSSRAAAELQPASKRGARAWRSPTPAPIHHTQEHRHDPAASSAPPPSRLAIAALAAPTALARPADMPPAVARPPPAEQEQDRARRRHRRRDEVDQRRLDTTRPTAPPHRRSTPDVATAGASRRTGGRHAEGRAPTTASPGRRSGSASPAACSPSAPSPA